MSTRTHTVLPLSLDRRAPRGKGKENAVVAKIGTGSPTRKRTTAWDPYEVWKTRVKDPSGSR
jgi:hypothetical protein